VKFQSHGSEYEIMILYFAVMSRKNLLEAGGAPKTPMCIYLSTRRHIPRNSSHLVNKTV